MCERCLDNWGPSLDCSATIPAVAQNISFSAAVKTGIPVWERDPRCYTYNGVNHSSCCGPFCTDDLAVGCLASPLPCRRCFRRRPSEKGTGTGGLCVGWGGGGDVRSSWVQTHEPAGSGNADAQMVFHSFLKITELTEVTW